MKYRVLVIGTGSIGERHARCLLSTARTEIGICEINDVLRSQVAERYGIKDSFASPSKALEHSWNAAVVATPAPFHIPIGIKLAEAGINLLIEKPLSISMEGIMEFREVVNRNKLIVRVAYVWHAHPGLREMREALRSGRFGRSLQIILVNGHHFPTARPAYREIYYADRAKGGGAIQDALTHMLNIGEWLLGPISRIAVDASHMLLEGVEVEDTVHAITRHESAMGCYCLNQYQAPTEMTITVICEKGTVRLEMHKSRWRWMVKPDSEWKDQPFFLKDRDDWFIRQTSEFLDTMEGKPDCICTLDEGIQTLKVNLAALKSADNEGAWQVV